MEKLAILGGPKIIDCDYSEFLKWPIITKQMEERVLEVLKKGAMSGTDLTKEFEKKYAELYGVKYALCHNNGTSAIHSALFGLKIGKGDEVICPSVTYWASCLPVFSLGGTVVFSDIEEESLCIDPADIERHITERTKVIIVVHYSGYPADMDRIMLIAKKYNLKILEDCSHSHWCFYKEKLTGTFGNVSCFSLMTGKTFPIGEGGILLTNDREIYERAIIFGHYERHSEITINYLKENIGVPWGGCKYRMHQLSSAVGIEFIKIFKEIFEEIDTAMNYFCDLLDTLPGIKTHRPCKNSGLTKGGWYYPLAHYKKEELNSLSITRFCEALRAEGVSVYPGCNNPLHMHPVFQNIDIYNDGKPTIIRNSVKDVRIKIGDLPISENIGKKVFSIPRFTK
ncbi:MAG: DegT/DnrJ/EryC1/StrS family aminotransferase, partial [bacterium]|nr:DegT/DnrJ/EryC1/StrS family aminotransferase [bacterium]MDW8163177.1 DegT/DnrJ/EryC1/StrS family aminotransferase [Candidatus Omnitrophota bacterium]